MITLNKDMAIFSEKSKNRKVVLVIHGSVFGQHLVNQSSKIKSKGICQLTELNRLVPHMTRFDAWFGLRP